MADLDHGLKTLEVGCTITREIYNLCMELLDPMRWSHVSTAANLPSTHVAGRFYRVDDTARIVWDDGVNYVDVLSYIAGALTVIGQLNAGNAIFSGADIRLTGAIPSTMPGVLGQIYTKIDVDGDAVLCLSPEVT